MKYRQVFFLGKVSEIYNGKKKTVSGEITIKNKSKKMFGLGSGGVQSCYTEQKEKKSNKTLFRNSIKKRKKERKKEMHFQR